MNWRHGMYGTPEYMAFRNAKNRCERPSDARYHRYGGRAGMSVLLIDRYCRHAMDAGQTASDVLRAWGYPAIPGATWMVAKAAIQDASANGREIPVNDLLWLCGCGVVCKGHRKKRVARPATCPSCRREFEARMGKHNG